MRVGYPDLQGLLTKMRYRWRINGENIMWIDCLAQGEEEGKGRTEGYQTCRFYHIVMSQACNTYYLGSYSVYNTHVS